MADTGTIEVGNTSILLTSPCDPFRDGHTTGYLEFYDERHRPPFPLSSQIVCDYLMRIWGNESEPALWRAGRMTGWIEALTENAQERLSAFQLRKRNRFWGEHKEEIQEAWEKSRIAHSSEPCIER